MSIAALNRSDGGIEWPDQTETRIPQALFVSKRDCRFSLIRRRRFPPMSETGRKSVLTGLRGRAEEVSDLLKLLANPQRLLIVGLLTEGECAVSEIEEKLGIRQPTLSQQLGALREAGVIAGRREAKAVIYQLTDERTRHLLDALCRIFRPEGLTAPRLESLPRTRPRAASSGAASFARVAPHLSR